MRIPEVLAAASTLEVGFDILTIHRIGLADPIVRDIFRKERQPLANVAPTPFGSASRLA